MERSSRKFSSVSGALVCQDHTEAVFYGVVLRSTEQCVHSFSSQAREESRGIERPLVIEPGEVPQFPHGQLPMLPRRLDVAHPRVDAGDDAMEVADLRKHPFFFAEVQHLAHKLVEDVLLLVLWELHVPQVPVDSLPPEVRVGRLGRGGAQRAGALESPLSDELLAVVGEEVERDVCRRPRLGQCRGSKGSNSTTLTADGQLLAWLNIPQSNHFHSHGTTREAAESAFPLVADAPLHGETTANSLWLARVVDQLHPTSTTCK